MVMQHRGHVETMIIDKNVAKVTENPQAARNLRAFQLIWLTQLIARVSNGMTAQ